MLFNDYFEGTAYGSSGADGFTVCTPVALFRLNDTDDVINQHNSITGAHRDTHPTLVALFHVYLRHFSQSS